jgi:hypothetical protein
VKIFPISYRSRTLINYHSSLLFNDDFQVSRQRNCKVITVFTKVHYWTLGINPSLFIRSNGSFTAELLKGLQELLPLDESSVGPQVLFRWEPLLGHYPSKWYPCSWSTDENFVYFSYCSYTSNTSGPSQRPSYFWDGYKIVNLRIKSRHISPSKSSNFPPQHLACFSLPWIFPYQNNKSEIKLKVFCKPNFDCIALRLDHVEQSVIITPLVYMRSTSQLHLDSYLQIRLCLSSDY